MLKKEPLQGKIYSISDVYSFRASFWKKDFFFYIWKYRRAASAGYFRCMEEEIPVLWSLILQILAAEVLRLC